MTERDPNFEAAKELPTKCRLSMDEIRSLIHELDTMPACEIGGTTINKAHHLITVLLETWQARGDKDGARLPSQELVDLHLNNVLRASGSALKNYTMPATLEAMRKAMSDAMCAAIDSCLSKGEKV